MHTILRHPDQPDRIVTLQPPGGPADENGNQTPEFERAFYEATEEPVGSLQELLERIQEKMKG